MEPFIAGSDTKRTSRKESDLRRIGKRIDGASAPFRL